MFLYLRSPFAGGCYGDKCGFTTKEWITFTGKLQSLAKQAGLDVPIIYGIDSVHGSNYVFDGTMFPQQIGAAASFNRTVTFSMGEINGRQTRNAGTIVLYLIVYNIFIPVTNILIFL